MRGTGLSQLSRWEGLLIDVWNCALLVLRSKGRSTALEASLRWNAPSPGQAGRLVWVEGEVRAGKKVGGVGGGGGSSRSRSYGAEGA